MAHDPSAAADRVAALPSPDGQTVGERIRNIRMLRELAGHDEGDDGTQTVEAYLRQMLDEAPGGISGATNNCNCPKRGFRR